MLHLCCCCCWLSYHACRTLYLSFSVCWLYRNWIDDYHHSFFFFFIFIFMFYFLSMDFSSFVLMHILCLVQFDDIIWASPFRHKHTNNVLFSLLCWHCQVEKIFLPKECGWICVFLWVYVLGMRLGNFIEVQVFFVFFFYFFYYFFFHSTLKYWRSLVYFSEGSRDRERKRAAMVFLYIIVFVFVCGYLVWFCSPAIIRYVNLK